MIVLALFDREPHTSRAAARWAARFTLERRLTLPGAQLGLSALAVLPGPAAAVGAEALIEPTQRYGLRRVEALLAGWLRTRGLAG